MKSQLDFARKMLDELKATDQRTSEAYYDMGRYLSVIYEAELYKLLGYDSLTALIEEELSFTQGTGSKYMRTYNHFTRLRLGKTSAVALIQKHSFTHLASVLPSIKPSKQLKTSISRAVQKDKAMLKQINFAVTSRDYKKLEALLIAFGAHKTKTGKLDGASAALVDIVNEFKVAA